MPRCLPTHRVADSHIMNSRVMSATQRHTGQSTCNRHRVSILKYRATFAQARGQGEGQRHQRKAPLPGWRSVTLVCSCLGRPGQAAYRPPLTTPPSAALRRLRCPGVALLVPSAQRCGAEGVPLHFGPPAGARGSCKARCPCQFTAWRLSNVPLARSCSPRGRPQLSQPPQPHSQRRRPPAPAASLHADAARRFRPRPRANTRCPDPFDQSVRAPSPASCASSRPP